MQLVQNTAAHEGRSMNDYLTRVLTAATSPGNSEPDIVRMRARLARAGVLGEVPTRGAERPVPEELERARLEAGRGVPLSDLVAEGRR